MEDFYMRSERELQSAPKQKPSAKIKLNMSEPRAKQKIHLIREAERSELDAIWKLNQSEVPHVGSVSFEDFEKLVVAARAVRVVVSDGKIAGFAVIFDEKGHYLSPNFIWFKARYPAFTYIDRIVVLPEFRRRGIARTLYDDAQKFADSSGSLLTCEVNLNPPNPDSIQFHEKLGFKAVGTQENYGGKITVQMYVRSNV